MNHCFLQTHKCNPAGCCRWPLQAACSHHASSAATHHYCPVAQVSLKMFIQDPDDWITGMMTGGWSLLRWSAPTGSWCTEGPPARWYPVQGALPLHAAPVCQVDTSENRVQTRPAEPPHCQNPEIQLYLCIYLKCSPLKKSHSCNYGLPVALFIGLFQEGFNRIPFGKNRVLQSPVYFDTHFFVTAERE